MNMFKKIFCFLTFACVFHFALGMNPSSDTIIALLKTKISESDAIGSDASERLIESSKRLLEAGVDIDESDRDGKTALMYAVSVSRELATFLVENGADVARQNRIGRTALFFAAESGDVETVRMLVEKGADFEKEDTYSFGLLCWAAKYGNVPVIEYLISLGLAIDEPSGYRFQTPLMAAAEGGHLEAVKYLVSRDARVDYANETGQSVLMGASNPEVIRFLVENGARIDRKNSLGFTPLVFAVLNDDAEALATLISLGANANDRGRYDEPILGIAIQQRRSELVRILIDGGADIEMPINGFTPFVAAAKEGMTDVLEFFKEKGVDPRDNQKALLQASLKGHLDTMEWLLGEGVAIDYKDPRYKQTALYVAVATKQVESVRFLLEAGANPNVVDSKGESVYARAERLNVAGILSLLKQHGANR